jgi:hypothetical protein
MKRLSNLPRRELEKLSAYLDGQLSVKETVSLELRLKKDPHLLRAFRELEATKVLLGQAPTLRIPRSFVLSPEVAGIRTGPRRAYTVLRFATAAVTLAFVVLVGTDVLSARVFTSGQFANISAEVPAEMMLEAAEADLVEEQFALELPADQERAVAPMEMAEEEALEPEPMGEVPASEAPREPSLGEAEENSDELPAYEGEIPAPTAMGTPILDVLPSGAILEGEESNKALLEDCETCDLLPGDEQDFIPLTVIEQTTADDPLLEDTIWTADGISVAREKLPIIRLVEIGLGLTAVLLAILTLFLRRQR